MTSTIQAVGRVLRGGDPKVVPEWTSPIPIEMRRVTPRESPYKRAAYFWGEQRLMLEEDGAPIAADSNAIARTTYLKVPQAGGSYLLQPVKAYTLEQWAAHTSVKSKAARSPAPPTYGSSLAAFSLFVMTPRNHGQPQSIRGARQVRERLATRGGVQVRLSPDRQSVLPSGNRSNFAAAMAAAPLLWSLLHDDKPPVCEVSVHPEPVEAIDVADAFPDGLPWCGCQP